MFVSPVTMYNMYLDLKLKIREMRIIHINLRCQVLVIKRAMDFTGHTKQEIQHLLREIK